MAVQALILGCAGTTLSGEERAFFKEAQPWGLILFKRNVADHAQLERLIGEFRETVGRERRAGAHRSGRRAGAAARAAAVAGLPLGRELRADRRPLAAAGSDKARRAPHRA